MAPASRPVPVSRGCERQLTREDLARVADFVIAMTVHRDRSTGLPLFALIETTREGSGMTLADGFADDGDDLYEAERWHAVEVRMALSEGRYAMPERPSPWRASDGDAAEELGPWPRWDAPTPSEVSSLLPADVANYLTRAVVALEQQPEQGDDRAVFLVTRCLPLPGYGLRPEDDEKGWDEVADCLYAIGALEHSVLEAWATRSEASRRCLEVAAELGDHLHHVLRVRPMGIGAPVQWQLNPQPVSDLARSTNAEEGQ